jgi:ADP-L-glycero-D-manno-heptose 6-epimerase|tara:strand:- start:3359 stop:4321 length:963 start_codon:yes stop_codon:yes gene_type:complete
MIVVTGAAGFIPSVLVSKLNKLGFEDLLLVDDFTSENKRENYVGKSFKQLVNRIEFIAEIDNVSEVDFVFHLGARTDTTEFDVKIFNELNLNYSKTIWTWCSKNKIPLVYASSAATYGGGEHGYDDNHEIISELKPLNPYGDSKNDFDKWAIAQSIQPPFWAGLKFFNVYGPNEYHKSRMASVVFHAFNQITDTGTMNLFKSHNPNYKDGEQLRDFVYVKDVVEVCCFLMNNKAENGLYNLGTGKARSFVDLVKATFNALEVETSIGFIPTPIDIRDKYQYFTEANMQKLIDNGYSKPFTSLEDGVDDYVRNYLLTKNYC